ncbi:MAG: hypothetical protein ACT4NP_09860 [Pseudonocardiales bacterium]
MAVVRAGEQQVRQYRAEQAREHVPLGVPDIALGGEELVGRRARRQRRTTTR